MGPVNVTVVENNQEIISKLEQILSNQLQERITDLATAQEVRDLLSQINAVTTEVAEDITTLLNRPEVPDEVKTDAEVLLGRLREVAAAYPVTGPAPTPDEPAPGSDEPLPGLEEGAGGEVGGESETPTTGTTEGTANPQ